MKKTLRWGARLLGVVALALITRYVWTHSLPDSFILLLLVVCVITTGVLSLLVRTSSGVRELVLKIARRAWGWDGGDIPSAAPILLGTALVGTVLGVWAYTDRVNAFQKALVHAYSTRDVVTTLLAAEPGAYSRTPDNKPLNLQGNYLYNVLRRLGLLSRDELRNGPRPFETPPKTGAPGSPNLAIATATLQPAFINRYVIGAPTLDLVIALSNTDSVALPDYEVKWTRTALANMLARVPNGPGWEPPLRLPEVHNRCTGKTPEECEDEATRNLNSLKVPVSSSLIMHLPPEITPYQAVSELDRLVRFGATAPLPKHNADGDQLASHEAIPRFQAALLDALRNDDEVRDARMWLNALVGPERLLILILAFWFVMLTLARTVQSLPHEAHAIAIRESLDDFRHQWRNTFPEAKLRLEKAEKLLSGLSGPAAVNSRLVTIPSILLRAAVDEMASRLSATAASTPAAVAAPDARAIETAAEGLRSRLGHSRLIFEAMLPTFPAIGFVGTVTSLLVAMSKADQIVKATDALARGSATSAVTDVLSLCFAATLMALICLIVLAPLSLWQSARELRLVNNTEHLLQDVLKPEQP